MKDIEEFLSKLRDKFVIVEGQKDKKALLEFGINNVVTLTKKPIFELAEEISKITDEVVILTDLDKEGKRLYSKLKDNFCRLGIKVDDRVRTFLFKETKLTHIQGLVNYINKF